MTRAIHFGNYSVYILREVGQSHHLPHAHIKFRDHRIASVFLGTLTIFDQSEKVPRALPELIQAEQARLIGIWEEMNKND